MPRWTCEGVLVIKTGKWKYAPRLRLHAVLVEAAHQTSADLIIFALALALVLASALCGVVVCDELLAWLPARSCCHPRAFHSFVGQWP